MKTDSVFLFIIRVPFLFSTGTGILNYFLVAEDL
jgi:hypothetical protein